MYDVLFTQIRLELEALIENSVRKVISEKIFRPGNSESIGDKLLTIKQAAILLNLAVPTIYGLVHRSKIPYMKRNKRLYFSEKELREWIKAGRRQTIQEIRDDAAASLYQER